MGAIKIFSKLAERQQTCCGPSWLAHLGDLRSSPKSKLQILHHLPFKSTTKSLLWYPFRCVELKARSVYTAKKEEKKCDPLLHTWTTSALSLYIVCLFVLFCLFLFRFAVEIFFAELCDIYLVRKVISVMWSLFLWVRWKTPSAECGV